MASELTKEEQEAKLIKKYEKLNTEDKDKWTQEIELLEQSVKRHAELDIGEGVKVAILKNLNEENKRLFVTLIKELRSLGKKEKLGTRIFNEDGTEQKEWGIILSDTDEKRGEDIAYEVIELVTINPLFTKKWFKNNPDKFNAEALFNNIFLYYNLQSIQWLKRVGDIKSFRK